MSQDIPPETMNRIMEAIFAGHKIKAIKLYRESRATSLVDAKEFVEQLTKELRDKYPASFASQPASGCAALFTVIVAIVSAISCIAIAVAVDAL